MTVDLKKMRADADKLDALMIRNASKSVIHRERLYVRASRFEWKWVYSVALPGRAPVTIGTRLAEARRWAKARNPADIVLAWEWVNPVG